MNVFMLIATLLIASPAGAATITEISGFNPHGGIVPLSAGDFTRVGACGGGLSVQSDGCSAASVGALQEKFGRYSGEVDSQDANQLWSLTLAKPASVVQFSVSDMMDMPWSEGFRITATADAVWQETQRQPNGTVRYFELALGKAQRSVAILFEHLGLQPGKAFSGDGFGVGVCHKG